MEDSLESFFGVNLLIYGILRKWICKIQDLSVVTQPRDDQSDWKRIIDSALK